MGWCRDISIPEYRDATLVWTVTRWEVKAKKKKKKKGKKERKKGCLKSCIFQLQVFLIFISFLLSNVASSGQCNLNLDKGENMICRLQLQTAIIRKTKKQKQVRIYHFNFFLLPSMRAQQNRFGWPDTVWNCKNKNRLVAKERCEVVSYWLFLVSWIINMIINFQKDRSQKTRFTFSPRNSILSHLLKKSISDNLYEEKNQIVREVFTEEWQGKEYKTKMKRNIHSELRVGKEDWGRGTKLSQPRRTGINIHTPPPKERLWTSIGQLSRVALHLYYLWCFCASWNTWVYTVCDCDRFCMKMTLLLRCHVISGDVNNTVDHTLSYNLWQCEQGFGSQ